MSDETPLEDREGETRGEYTEGGQHQRKRIIHPEKARAQLCSTTTRVLQRCRLCHCHYIACSGYPTPHIDLWQQSGVFQRFLRLHREILRHYIAIRIATGETGMREGRHFLKRGHRIVAKSGKITQHPVSIYLALALDIGQHSI